MGGGSPDTPLTSNPGSDENSSVDQDVPRPYYLSGKLYDHETMNEEFRLAFGEFEKVGCKFSPNSLEVEANQRNRYKAYKLVLQSYDQFQSRAASLTEAKDRILSYSPGRWMEKVGGMELSDYNVPKTTTLLLVGPRGSGKSSLINRISKVFEDDKFAPERAQVSYNSSAGEGTYFLQEYIIPRGSSAFCLYDTRGFCDDSNDNIEMLKQWMKLGVRHGELMVRPCNNSSLRTRMKSKARESSSHSKESRMVNFVIFVVNGLAVLRSMGREVEEGNLYAQMIASTFNCPYLSFKDDKPVVVVTHGDLLSLSDRACVRVQLGELLGIPPAKQIFDIPDSCDPVTDLTIVDMLRYSLEHADKNFPQKDSLAEKVHRVRGSLSPYVLRLFIMLGIVILSISIKQMRMYHESDPEDHVDWHSIRHLWLE